MNTNCGVFGFTFDFIGQLFDLKLQHLYSGSLDIYFYQENDGFTWRYFFTNQLEYELHCH